MLTGCDIELSYSKSYYLRKGRHFLSLARPFLQFLLVVMGGDEQG
jgi:hypothetical protein